MIFVSNIVSTVRADGAVVLTFDQPGSKANVLSPTMWSDLNAALIEAKQMPGIRGLVLASAKPGIFIAGADLNVIGSATSTNDPAVRSLIEQGLRVLELLEDFPVSTVAVIDGAALGGGLEVALACDFRLVGSHPKCSLGLPETTLGLIPGWGGTQRLPRIVGPENACEMIATAKPVTASQAVDMGLADALMPSESLMEDAVKVVLSRNPESRRQTKKNPIPEAIRAKFRPSIGGQTTAVRTGLLLVESGADKPLSEAIPRETSAFQQLAGSDESRHMIQAFFNRKKA